MKVVINMDNLNELENEMELLLEDKELTPRDMIDIVFETLAENGVLIRS